MPDTLADAPGAVAANGYEPDLVLMNPGDVGGDPLVLNALLQLWDVTLAVSPGVAAGTAYAADLTVAVTLFEQGDINIFLSGSHGDLFLRNEIVILAETGALAAVIDLDAIAKADLE